MSRNLTGGSMPLHKQPPLECTRISVFVFFLRNQSRVVTVFPKAVVADNTPLENVMRALIASNCSSRLLSFECYANRFTMICIINYLIINFERIQHVDNGILTSSRHCKIFIGKICNLQIIRGNVICGNTHRLFAVNSGFLNAAICFK